MSPSVLTASAPFRSHRCKIYILLLTDPSCRWADMFPVTAAEFTAEGTASILVNQCILLWGCPRTILSDNRLQFCSKLSQAVYQLLGVHELATCSYHPNCNEGVERVNTAQVCKGQQLFQQQQIEEMYPADIIAEEAAHETP